MLRFRFVADYDMHPNVSSAQKPVLYPECNVPKPKPLNEEENMSCSDNSFGSSSSGYCGVKKKHFISQPELNDLIRDLKLSKVDSEVLASRLLQWNCLDKSTKVSIYRDRSDPFSVFFFTKTENICYCNNIDGLFEALKLQHIPNDWRLFIDSSKTSLKFALLHNGNKLPTIPIAHAVNTKETYEHIAHIFQLIQYNKYKWKVCADFKVIAIITGLQGGFTKYCCFICLWDSRARQHHFHREEWPLRKNFAPGALNVSNPPLVLQDNVTLPPLHIKLGLMKNFVKTLDKDDPAFQYLIKFFPNLSFAKVKEGIFVGPQIKKLMQDQQFIATMSPQHVNAWNSFMEVGWNDLGFHGSAQIPTPNIDALAYSGLILNRYYVTPICTPSRSALMTGKYPIHTGMQHAVIYGAEPRGLPLSEKILPEYLNDLGYTSHIVGKWHLGHYQRKYTPLYRGFKSHTGFWTGHHDYFDHTAVEKPLWGLDIRRGLDVAYDLHGKYSTDIVTDESVKLIREHNSTKPLFLYVSHAAVHSGNPYNPLPAPDHDVAKMSHISNFNRRKYAAILSKMDDSVGEIVNELHKHNMLKDSIIVFSTDNGGPAEGFNINHASNWPLRGVKNTLFEGGVRGAGLLWSPLIKKRNRVAEQTMHIADWLPTLYRAAGGDMKDLKPELDGISIWDELSEDNISPRKEILHNIDDIYGNAALTTGNWKVMKGSTYQGKWDGWYGPAGLRNESSYNFNSVIKSPAGKSVVNLRLMPSLDEIGIMRSAATIRCRSKAKPSKLLKSEICHPLSAPCLFNIHDDPCEHKNVADKYPDILKVLLNQLDKYNATVVSPNNKKKVPRGNPRLWDNTWTNFGDYPEENCFDL